MEPQALLSPSATNGQRDTSVVARCSLGVIGRDKIVNAVMVRAYLFGAAP